MGTLAEQGRAAIKASTEAFGRREDAFKALVATCAAFDAGDIDSDGGALWEARDAALAELNAADAASREAERLIEALYANADHIVRADLEAARPKGFGKPRTN